MGCCGSAGGGEGVVKKLPEFPGLKPVVMKKIWRYLHQELVLISKILN